MSWLTPGVLCALPQGPAGSTEDLHKRVQNPVANLISVPFQNNINFPAGPYSRVQNVLNIQPVIPAALSVDWQLITRWIAPVIYQPNIFARDGGTNGLGDMNPTFFLSPTHPGKVIWGKWGAGPSLVLLTQPPHWTIGILANNIWSFAGNRDRRPVNQALVQYFVNYNMGNGWYTGTQPILTANWRISSRNRWLVPFGWSVGRVMKIGSQAINAQLGAYYNLIHPLDLPYGKWQVRVQIALLFPTVT